MIDPTLSKLSNAALIEAAGEWVVAGHRVALAFVVATWGSSPRPVGSVMVVRDDNHVAGSVSGGCVENAVIEAARDSINEDVGRRLDFGVSDDTAWDLGLSCGGKISVLISPIADTGIPKAALAVLCSDASARRVMRLSLNAENGRLGAELAQHSGRAVLDQQEAIFHFVQMPPSRLIIIGGGHIAQFLAPMAGLAGYDVSVIDPRAMFLTPARFPDINMICEWPQDALPHIALDAQTALVALTHDPKIDDPALHAALASEAGYIAALGSRRTHAARCDRLGKAGISAADLARVHGPAGLDIGAMTPAEIAVSILAQMIKTSKS